MILAYARTFVYPGLLNLVFTLILTTLCDNPPHVLSCCIDVDTTLPSTMTDALPLSITFIRTKMIYHGSQCDPSRILYLRNRETVGCYFITKAFFRK